MLILRYIIRGGRLCIGMVRILEFCPRDAYSVVLWVGDAVLELLAQRGRSNVDIMFPAGVARLAVLSASADDGSIFRVNIYARAEFARGKN